MFRAVTESINHLINICTVSAPGQKECDNALRQIQVRYSLTWLVDRLFSGGIWVNDVAGL